jgi:hypothetical protein
MHPKFVLPKARFGLRLPWYISALSYAYTLSSIRYEGSELIDSENENAALPLNVLRLLWSSSGSMRDYQEVYSSYQSAFFAKPYAYNITYLHHSAH